MTEKEAKAKASYLSKRLRKKLGGDWQGRAWYNLHWCCDAYLGSISVKENQDPLTEKFSYTAFINDDIDSSSGSLGAWMKDSNTAKTPEEAVENALENAQDYINRLQLVITNSNLLIMI